MLLNFNISRFSFGQYNLSCYTTGRGEEKKPTDRKEERAKRELKKYSRGREKNDRQGNATGAQLPVYS